MQMLRCCGFVQNSFCNIMSILVLWLFVFTFFRVPLALQIAVACKLLKSESELRQKAEAKRRKQSKSKGSAHTTPAEQTAEVAAEVLVLTHAMDNRMQIVSRVSSVTPCALAHSSGEEGN